jgi:hypothetical protein
MSNQPKMMIEEARCGVRLSYVIFPIDVRELRHILAKNGYELVPVSNIPPPPTRIRYSGDVARKGEITVSIESDSGEIGVVGRSLQDVRSAFEDLAKIINSELDVDLYENVRFYWYVLHYKINSGKRPFNEISKAENKDYIQRFGKVLEEELSLSSIRLAPKDASPNQENWFDIAIEPDVENETIYHVGVVFRNSDKSKTEKFVRDLESNILKIIRTIEA